MALQTSGQISLNDIHLEAGGASGTQAGINDSDIRALISAGSGTEMGFSDFYGASLPAAYRSASTGFVTGDAGVQAYSLTSLGAQQGDLVIVATCQDGPASLTPSGMTGWNSLVPNGTTVTFVQDIYYKVMGASPESSFNCSIGPYPFNIPVVALCISNVGALQTQTYIGQNGVNNIDPPSRTVSNAGSVGIVVLCRDDNAAGNSTSSGPSGYTKAGNMYTANAGIGFNWEQSVDVFYKLNLPVGTENPSAISWSQGFDNATATTAIFY